MRVLKLLIPIFDRRGALEAARHCAVLFAEHCVSEVEVVEVLDASHLDPIRKWEVLFGLHRLTRTPVTILQ